MTLADGILESGRTFLKCGELEIELRTDGMVEIQCPTCGMVWAHVDAKAWISKGNIAFSPLMVPCPEHQPKIKLVIAERDK